MRLLVVACRSQCRAHQLIRRPAGRYQGRLGCRHLLAFRTPGRHSSGALLALALVMLGSQFPRQPLPTYSRTTRPPIFRLRV